MQQPLDESPEECAKWKKLIPPNYILYDSTYIIFSKWQNYRNAEHISDYRD